MTACADGGPSRMRARRWGHCGSAHPQPARALVRGAALSRFRELRAAGPDVHHAAPGPIPADQRGLPDPQRGGSRRTGPRSAAGHGVHPRRRLHPGQLGHPDLRRGGAGPARLRLRLGELPARRARMSGSVLAVDVRASPWTATCSCATWCSHCAGCATTSRRSAATRTTSRSSGRARARMPSPRCWRYPRLKACSPVRSPRAPPRGLVRGTDVAAEFADRFAGAARGARRRRRPRPAAGLAGRTAGGPGSVDRPRAARDMLGAFPIGPVSGDDLLPVDPVEAMRQGTAHRVPLIVGSNADEGRLFTRFLRLLPTTEPMVEAVLAGAGPGVRDRIVAAYPDYPESGGLHPPRRRLRLQRGGLGDRRSPRGARTHLRLSLRLRAAGTALVGDGRHPRHRTVRGVRRLPQRRSRAALLTAGADRRAALQVSRQVQRRWSAFSRDGVPGEGWPVYTEADRAVLVIDRKPRVEFDPAPERRKAWRGFSLAR